MLRRDRKLQAPPWGICEGSLVRLSSGLGDESPELYGKVSVSAEGEKCCSNRFSWTWLTWSNRDWYGPFGTRRACLSVAWSPGAWTDSGSYLELCRTRSTGVTQMLRSLPFLQGRVIGALWHPSLWEPTSTLLWVARGLWKDSVNTSHRLTHLLLAVVKANAWEGENSKE